MGQVENCIALGLSVFSIIWTSLWTFILYKFKPDLKIEDLVVDNYKQRLKVTVINNSSCYDAVNVNIEMCVVEGKYVSIR